MGHNDDSISVLIAGDLSGLTAALKGGTTAVNGFAGETKAAFESVAAADTATSKQVQANSAETLKGFVNLKQGGIFAMDALRAKLIETTSEVARLRSEILETNDAATLQKLNAELVVAQKEMTAARFEMRALNMEARETTEKANMLGESLGVKIPGAVGRLLGQLPAVQTAMAAAFTVSIVAFFISMLQEAVNKLGELGRAAVGFGEEEQKQYLRAIEFNERLISKNLELKDKMEAVAAIGKEGAAKYAIEARNSEESVKRWGERLAEITPELTKSQQELERLTRAASRWMDPLAGLTDVDFQLEKQKEHVKGLREEYDALYLKLHAEKPAETASRIAEEGARARAELQKTNETKITTERSYGDALTSYEESEYKRRFTLGEVTLEQEIAQLKAAEERKFALEEAAAAKLRELKVQEGARTGRNVQPELLEMDAKISQSRIESNKKLNELDAQLSLGQIARAKQTSDAEISAKEKVTEASLRANLEEDRFALQHADTVKKVQAASTDLIKTETALFESQFQAVQAKAAVLVATLSQDQNPTAQLGTNEFAQQLEAIKNVKPKIYAELISLNAQELALHKELGAAVVKIENETSQKVEDIRVKSAERDLATVLRMSNATLEAATKSDNDRLAHHQITMGKWEQQEYDALNRWYATELTAVKRAEDVIAQARGKEGDDYKKLKDKEIELEQQYSIKVMQIEQKIADQHAQLTQRMTNAFTSEVNSVLLGQQRIGQAAAHLGQQLELYIIDEGIKRVATHYLGSLVDMIAAHSSFLSSILGIETAGNAEKQAQAKLAQIGQVTADAGVAGAAGFASVMEAVPFPENVALAPEIAADAIGQTMAFGAFERGGIINASVGQAVPIIAHGGEAVLPQRLTSLLHSVANSSVDNSRGPTTIHNRPNITIHQSGASMSPAEITRAVRKGMRYGHSIGLPRV